jgi:hypothetical protein
LVVARQLVLILEEFIKLELNFKLTIVDYLALLPHHHTPHLHFNHHPIINLHPPLHHQSRISSFDYFMFAIVFN